MYPKNTHLLSLSSFRANLAFSSHQKLPFRSFESILFINVYLNFAQAYSPLSRYMATEPIHRNIRELQPHCMYIEKSSRGISGIEMDLAAPCSLTFFMRSFTFLLMFAGGPSKVCFSATQPAGLQVKRWKGLRHKALLKSHSVYIYINKARETTSAACVLLRVLGKLFSIQKVLFPFRTK